MMTSTPTSGPPRRRRGRGMRPWLILLKSLGLLGFLGGLGALAAIGRLGPVPQTLIGWADRQAVTRAIFFPCVFAGLVLAVLCGIVLLLQQPRAYLGMRWFRLKVVLLVIALPALHLFARGRVAVLVEALNEERLLDLPAAWSAVADAYLVSFIVMLPIAALGRFKPRLRQPFRWAKKRGS